MSEELDDELESPNQPTEEVDKTEDVEETTPEVETEDTAALVEKNKKLFERAKKAEAELKALKATAPRTTSPANTNPTNPPVTLDPEAIAKEVRLLAGLSDEEIAQAKKVSKVTGSIDTAITDELFLTWQKDYKEKQRREKARLGASHGSGQANSADDFSRPMTDEEHKAAWEKRYKR